MSNNIDLTIYYKPVILSIDRECFDYTRFLKTFKQLTLMYRDLISKLAIYTFHFQPGCKNF